MNELDLKFPNYPIGTHQVPWDLKILLFNGAAKVPRKLGMTLIDEGGFGKPVEDRIPLVIAIHEAISSMISLGKSRALIESSLEVLLRFFAWSERNSECISRETLIDVFKRWTEFQIHRSHIKKEVSAIYAYGQASKMANLIAKALQLPGARPGGTLLLQTRMRKPSEKKRVLGVDADKQNLSYTFEYGHILTKICEALDLETVRGKLPILINVGDETMLTLAGNEDATVRCKAKIARAPLNDSESLFDRHKRSGILNLRIEAELLIFIAQTGMNLTQAAILEKESYRWKSNGDDLEVFRVYKCTHKIKLYRESIATY